MKIANHEGRLVLVSNGGLVDVAKASDGRFAPEPERIYEQWDDFVAWAAAVDVTACDQVAAEGGFRAPSPRPTHILAVGLNYPTHSEELNVGIPPAPIIFAKSPTSIAGPTDPIVIPTGSVFIDWEAELVVVMGRRAHHVGAEQSWSHVAGVTLGQDLTNRVLQFTGPNPQFGLAKSYPGFSPTGPTLVTADEFDDPDGIEVTCHLNGERMQRDWTSSMVFTVPEIIAHISAIQPLLPGDLIFTGSPAGIGVTRKPPRQLRPGDELATSNPIIGTMTHPMV